MTWLRLDDKFPRHRKVWPLSDAAFRLHVTAMAHAAENGTDGRLDRAVAQVLTAVPQGKRLNSAIYELEQQKLWDRTDDGWQIHDFLDWNPSEAEVRAKRAARAIAGANGGREKARRRSLAIATATGQQLLQQNSSKPPSNTPSNGLAKSCPDPGPTKVLNLSPKDLSGSDAREREANPNNFVISPYSDSEQTSGQRLSKAELAELLEQEIVKLRSGT